MEREYAEGVTEIQERESREAEAIDQDADTTGEGDESTVGLMSDFKLDPGYHTEEAPGAEFVSKVRVVVHQPNGPDDVEEEIEDESEVDEECE